MPPPDRYRFNLDAPHPNVDIDAMRRLTKQTLAGVDDAYWLVGLLSELLTQAIDDAATERQQCSEAIAELAARLDALQSPEPPTEAP